MLIFDSEALTVTSGTLERAERNSLRLKKAMGTIFSVGALGIFSGLATATFNGVVPFVGMLVGVHDTWGRPELIGPQLIMAVMSFAAMVSATCIVGPFWDRAEAKVSKLKLEETLSERRAEELVARNSADQCSGEWGSKRARRTHGDCPLCDEMLRHG